jgi:hypothetical protein
MLIKAAEATRIPTVDAVVQLDDTASHLIKKVAAVRYGGNSTLVPLPWKRELFAGQGDEIAGSIVELPRCSMRCYARFVAHYTPRGRARAPEAAGVFPGEKVLERVQFHACLARRHLHHLREPVLFCFTRFLGACYTDATRS